MVGKGVAAVRPGGDFPPKQPFGVGDHVGGAAGEGLQAVAPDELVDAPLPDVAGGDLGLHVPDGHARHPHVGPEQGEESLIGLSAPVELQPGNPQAVLKDFGVVAGRTAGEASPQVEMVSRAHGKGRQAVLPEDGLHDEDVGNVHAPVEGVVENEDVARAHALSILPEESLHGVGHRAQVQGGGDPLGDHLALGVAKRGGVVQAIADDGGVGGPVEGQRHLVGGGGQGVLDDLPGDGIEGGLPAGSAAGCPVSLTHPPPP